MLLDLSLIWPDLAWLLPGGLLYAEMHYRWWPLPNRYFRKEPEILADAPWRVEPGKPVPLLLLVKDAHHYPITLERVTIGMETDNGRRELPEITIGGEIDDHWWHRTVMLERPIDSGDISLWVTFHYIIKGRPRTCTTHNLRSLKPQPLRVHLAGESLPGEDVVWGDLHLHTSFTEDMVEFGAPQEATRQAASAAGLGFICAADHSYDLDDVPGDWFTPDPKLAKWHTSREEIAALNTQGDGALIVPGEEVSVRNASDQNVHALVLGHPEFLPGSGDAGERLFRMRSELNVEALVQRIAPGSIAMAAHPCYQFPLIQQVLVRRGAWKDQDMQHPGIRGLQILNGRLDEGFNRGMEKWRGLLLRGHRKFIYAGNDAHGNFNMYRQVRTPFVNLEERSTNLPGTCRTGVLDVQPGDMAGILAALKAGRCIVSTGPFINLRLNAEGGTAAIGETIRARKVEVSLELGSTTEFGPLADFRLFRGWVGPNSGRAYGEFWTVGGLEETLEEVYFDDERHSAEWKGAYELQPGTSYFRAEVESRPPGGRIAGLALTNPIWVESF
ncbi:MAG: CehA/McbA family metallohydrolase [Fidelibacterota bacterium]|nr:MAG: CehA/McbA family metallohydrolase [Candidatus Neomarinimicrobiota bacterium]